MHFADTREKISTAMREFPEKFEKMKTLVVDYESLSLTIVLSLMLLIYLFADDVTVF